jgi:hypothetical protein
LAGEVDGGKWKRGALRSHNLCMTLITDKVINTCKGLEKLYQYPTLSESLLLYQKMGSFCLRYWKLDIDLLGTCSR